MEVKGTHIKKAKTWRRKWQPTPVFLPGKSHGQRNLAGYSTWHSLCPKESDTTELLNNSNQLSEVMQNMMDRTHT